MTLDELQKLNRELQGVRAEIRSTEDAIAIVKHFKTSGAIGSPTPIQLIRLHDRSRDNGALREAGRINTALNRVTELLTLDVYRLTEATLTRDLRDLRVRERALVATLDLYLEVPGETP